MIKLDDNLLAELGLHALPPEEKKALLRHIYETLEMRVGTTLARQMTDAQLDEFESFINSNDEAGALHWLETNFPNYKDVVAQEFEALKHEVRSAAPQILADAQQGAIPQGGLPPQHYAPQPQQYEPVPQGYQQPAPGQYPQQHPGAQPGQPQQPYPAQYQGQQPPYDQDQYEQAA